MVSLPPVPTREPMLDDNGIVKRVWSTWFDQLKIALSSASASGGSDDDSAYVTKTTTVNGYPLSTDIVIPIPEIVTPIAATDGGTGLFSYALGDTLYASAADTLSALVGNKTTTIKYLSQVGDGTSSSAPSWHIPIIDDLGDAISNSSSYLFLGSGSGIHASGTHNTGVGVNSLNTLTTGTENTAIGYFSMQGATGGSNTAVGVQTAYQASGTGNTAVGWHAYYQGTGDYNTIIGLQAYGTPDAGTYSGSHNIAIGYTAGYAQTTGSYNILIGDSVSASSASASYYLNIGGVITGQMDTGAITLANGFKATTQTAGDNSTKIATTAYVDAYAPSTIKTINEATDTTCFPLFVTASGTQTLQAKNNTGLTYNSNTNNLGCTTFTGALVGNADTVTHGIYTTDTGTVTGTIIASSVALAGNPTTTTQSATDNSTRIATTAYVTTGIANAIAGVNPAVAVQAATTAAGDTSGFTYNNGASGIGATLTGTVNTAITIDGYTFTALGQRLLVKDDTQSPSGAYNGVYYVTQVQTVLLAPILTRALDYDMPSDINNTGAIPVVNGTVNALTSWLLTSSITTVGTDPMTYVEFSRNINDILTFKTISVSGQSDVVADTFADTLTLAAGSGITLTTNASTDTITITSTASGGGLPTATAGGTADAITADFTPDLTLTDLTICAVVAGSANATSTPTFAPDGLTAHTITKNGGSALVAGDIAGAGDTILLEYNAANTRWELLNPSTAVIPAGTITGAMMSGTGAVRTIVCNVSGGFSVLPTGAVSMPITVPFTGTIAKWYMAADQSGSCVIDVKRSGTSIVGAGNKPTLSSVISNNAALASWTSTAITKGDILTFNVDSVTTCLSVNLVLEVTVT